MNRRSADPARRFARGPSSRPLVHIDFVHSTDAPARARSAVLACLADDPLQDDLILTASELVTNVVRHTSDGGSLEVYDGAVVVVEVHDTDPTPPARREPGPHGGFGIEIVSVLADAWGTECTLGGKTVWAAFNRRD